MLLDLLGAAHHQIIQDHWLSFAGDTTVEAAQGLETSTDGELPLSRHRHTEIMAAFLSTGPARRCFTSHKSMAAMRDGLLARVC